MHPKVREIAGREGTKDTLRDFDPFIVCVTLFFHNPFTTCFRVRLTDEMFQLFNTVLMLDNMTFILLSSQNIMF